VNRRQNASVQSEVRAGKTSVTGKWAKIILLSTLTAVFPVYDFATATVLARRA
jgi:hypothetical protein